MTTASWELLWTDYRESARTNPAQAYRRKLVHELLDIRTPSRVIDAGSGPGDLLAEIGTRYPFVETLGIELSAAGIEQAKKIAPGAAYVQRDLCVPQRTPEEYLEWATHAVCSEVLEHVANPTRFLQELRPFLKPGGRLVVTVPSGPRSAFDRFLGHRRHFTKESLTEALTNAGFRCVDVRRAGFPFFNVYRLLVVLRGKKLIEDARTTRTGFLSKVFALLFRLNLRSSPWGWQLVATCVV